MAVQLLPQLLWLQLLLLQLMMRLLLMMLLLPMLRCLLQLCWRPMLLLTPLLLQLLPPPSPVTEGHAFPSASLPPIWWSWT